MFDYTDKKLFVYLVHNFNFLSRMINVWFFVFESVGHFVPNVFHETGSVKAVNMSQFCLEMEDFILIVLIEKA